MDTVLKLTRLDTNSPSAAKNGNICTRTSLIFSLNVTVEHQISIVLSLTMYRTMYMNILETVPIMIQY